MIVKICGTTNEDDALLSVALGADLLGFVFAPSPRQVAAQVAADIVKRLPPEIVAVGVFRDEAPKRVVDVAHRSGMRAVQLHGRETAEQTRWIRQRVPLVIKAFPAGDAKVAQALDYGADIVLLDGLHPGSGEVWDRSLADQVPPGPRTMVAGGLDATNVAGVIARTGCWGVDVSSGVEKAPGVKDPVKLRAFIAAAKSADPGDTVDRSDLVAQPEPPGGPARPGGPERPGGPARRSGAVYDWEDEG